MGGRGRRNGGNQGLVQTLLDGRGSSGRRKSTIPGVKEDYGGVKNQSGDTRKLHPREWKITL